MKTCHGHNAAIPGNRFFICQTHNLESKAEPRYYFMPAALDLIEEAATLKDIILVTPEELERGYITETFLDKDDPVLSNVWVPGMDDQEGI